MAILMRSKWRRTLAAFLLILLVGCSSGAPNYRVRGDVTYAGEPVPTGTVLFEPDPAKGNKGRGVMAEIKDGKYETPAGVGIVGGPHIVRVQGFDGKGDPRGESLRGRPLFPETALAIEFPEQDTTHDFHIPKK